MMFPSREFGLVGILLCIGAPAAAQSSQLTSRESIDAMSDPDPIQLAYQDFELTGVARVIRPRQEGGSMLFPFGHVRAMMRCPRLNACMIVLEPGEALTDQPLSGDTERWIIDTSVTGSGEPTALVIVKPQSCDISTNLLIPTDRRVYELGLVSDACENNGGHEDYVRQLRFWYPDEMRAERQAEREELAVAPDSANQPDSVPDLNRKYDVKRGWFLGRKNYPWIPQEVFDDAVRTHIVLPEKARNAELPILYALEGGERQVLNYALRGDTIVADRVLHRAVLIVNRGGDEETIEIENRAPARREEGDR